LKLDRREVLHIAKLARVGLTEEEIEHFSEQLSHILENFEILRKADITGVPPTCQPNPLHTVLSKDCVEPSMDREDVLANAPAREAEFFRIRPVLDK